jgi:tetratricopeptide (TPR) repeat protein
MAERGDAAMAIALQTHALRRAPGHPRALADLTAARAAIVSPETAAEIYAAALRHEPDLAVHHRAVGSLQRFVGMERIAQALLVAVSADPSHAPAHAALGNIAARAGDRSGAGRAYALAVLLDWDFAAAHLALAQLFDTAGNARDGVRHLGIALALATHYESGARYAVRRVLLLKAPGSFLANALPDFCLDANRTDLDALYLTPGVTSLPPRGSFDVAFNAMAATEEHADAIERCGALVAAAGVPVVNDPARLAGVRRAALPHTLRDVPGCMTPPVRRLSRGEVAGALADGTLGGELPFPLLFRPIDGQRGDAFERVRDAGEIEAYLARYDAPAFTVTPFVDYRSADGFYRKYRVIVVGGVPYPYHLAISRDWLVHYWRVSDEMRAHDWMRAEEERFLREPAAVFATWAVTFAALAAAVGLDFFGVDCALDASGAVLVFECDPGAFVHAHTDVDGEFDYKFRYVPRIFAALDALLDEKRVQSGDVDSGLRPGVTRP